MTGAMNLGAQESRVLKNLNRDFENVYGCEPTFTCPTQRHRSHPCLLQPSETELDSLMRKQTLRILNCSRKFRHRFAM
jgi:hypothetical protein